MHIDVKEIDSFYAQLCVKKLSIKINCVDWALFLKCVSKRYAALYFKVWMVEKRLSSVGCRENSLRNSEKLLLPRKQRGALFPLCEYNWVWIGEGIAKTNTDVIWMKNVYQIKINRVKMILIVILQKFLDCFISFLTSAFFSALNKPSNVGPVFILI